jgi:hypothetical protein
MIAGRMRRMGDWIEKIDLVYSRVIAASRGSKLNP